MSSRSARPLLLACTALVAVSAILPAHAQDAATATGSANGGETQLQTIVVKGKRVQAGSVAETPLATETTADQLRQKEVKDLSDLGNTTEPGVDFIQAKPGRAGGLFIRGLTGPRVAVLVDEIPMPFLQSGARTSAGSPTTGINGQPSSFDLNSLAGLDVLRGADSSKVGSGALAGALSARTLEPEDLIGEGKDWGGLAKTGYDSEDDSFGGSAAIAKRVGSTSVLFQGSYTKGHETDSKGKNEIFGNSRTAPNPMDFVRNNLLFKFRHELEGGHSIGLTAERYDYTSDTNLQSLQTRTFTNANAATTFRANGYTGWDDTRRQRVSLDYKFDAPSSDTLIQAANLRFYWQQLEKDAGSDGFRNNGTRYVRANEAEERDFGIIGSAVSEFEAGGLAHQLRLRGNVVSFDTRQYISVFPATATTVSQSDIPDVDGTVVGLSLEDQLGFGDSGFSLTPGIRFDWHDYNPQNSAAFSKNTGYKAFGLPDGSSDSRFSPKLLAEYQLTESVGLFAQWSMAYRAPTVDELYGNFTNVAGGYASIGNPALKAETGQGFEVGAKWDTGDFTGGVTLFHNTYDNFIDSVTRTGVAPQPAMLFTYENRSDVRISGAEVKARKSFTNGFFAEASLAVAYGEYGDTDARLRSVAPLKSIVGIGYDQETWGTELTGIFSAAMPDDHTASTFDAPGYGVFNLTGWWEPEQFKGLRIQAGVYNIFDKTYWNAVGVASVNPNSVSSGNQPVDFYSEAGRSFKISLTQKF
ncbi:TonB-dependent hemoglobin/transferrin/lactoferrin family receptor [Rhizobium wuzhouense]|uniref:TonB-dependent receptor n=1 Tax=Rhizobium wuzhouense TaxID=1986026 RepID=A0ABX5NR57_9HYPH|nr:TonB-dependent hemoglobin/transferrin/lactoferrin family receptor [Rhizobium wuzhouense]PYB73357.1 TonB-dependent receptor [Rhizobium wuzhouense]